MKKKHTWANAIPKTRREKDIVRLVKNPDEFKRMKDLLESATRVTDNIGKYNQEAFKSVEEIVAFVTCRISDELPRKDVLIEELYKMQERYEERILPDEGSCEDTTVCSGRRVQGRTGERVPSSVDNGGYDGGEVQLREEALQDHSVRVGDGCDEQRQSLVQERQE